MLFPFSLSSPSLPSLFSVSSGPLDQPVCLVPAASLPARLFHPLLKARRRRQIRQNSSHHYCQLQEKSNSCTSKSKHTANKAPNNKQPLIKQTEKSQQWSSLVPPLPKKLHSQQTHKVNSTNLLMWTNKGWLYFMTVTMSLAQFLNCGITLLKT